MAHTEPPAPIEPDTPTPPPSLDVPLPPPLVGKGNPWKPADAENRDRILDWWRMWFRRVFFPWIDAWIAYWAAQWARLIAWINSWFSWAEDYIEDHAVNGYSWRKTETPIGPGNTVVTIDPGDAFTPLRVGDLVSDTTDDVTYGEIIEVLSDTTALVAPLGVLRGIQGFAGYGWAVTADTLNPEAPTTVTIPTDPTREPQIGDLVLDSSPAVQYGLVIAVIDSTTVTVEYIGELRGPEGIADLGTITVNPGVLAPYGDAGDTYQGQLAPFPQMVGAFGVETTARCWVRVYASESYMLADQFRDITTPLAIQDDHGCYLDYVSIPGLLSKSLTPGVQFTDLGSGVWVSIKNTNPAANATPEVTFDYRTFRE